MRSVARSLSANDKGLVRLPRGSAEFAEWIEAVKRVTTGIAQYFAHSNQAGQSGRIIVVALDLFAVTPWTSHLESGTGIDLVVMR